MASATAMYAATVAPDRSHALTSSRAKAVRRVATSASPEGGTAAPADERSAPVLDPRIARSKAALREALIALMEERGLDGFTVGDLCTRAGLNRGTFYNHFKDKDNLLDTFEDEVMEGLEAFRVKMQELEIRDLLKEKK